jgi:hypothetical protein
VAAFEITAHCGAVTGQRRHHHRRTVLGERFIERSSSALLLREGDLAMDSQSRHDLLITSVAAAITVGMVIVANIAFAVIRQLL